MRAGRHAGRFEPNGRHARSRATGERNQVREAAPSYDVRSALAQRIGAAGQASSLRIDMTHPRQSFLNSVANSLSIADKLSNIQ